MYLFYNCTIHRHSSDGWNLKDVSTIEKSESENQMYERQVTYIRGSKRKRDRVEAVVRCRKRITTSKIKSHLRPEIPRYSP